MLECSSTRSRETPSYLTAAENTAGAAVSYFGTGTTLQNQGPAFDAIYFRDLFVLGQIQPNSEYGNEAQAYATYMWTQRNVERTVRPERTDLRCERNRADGRDLLPPRRQCCPALAWQRRAGADTSDSRDPYRAAPEMRVRREPTLCLE